MSTDGTSARAAPSRRSAIAGLAGAAFAAGAVAGGAVPRLRDLGRRPAPLVPAGTGPLLWTADVEVADERFFGPDAAGRLLLVERPFDASRRERSSALTCLDAATGHRLWSVPLPAEPGTPHSVVVSGSVVLVRTQGELQALDLRTGRVRWRHERNATGSGTAAVTAGPGLVLDSAKDDNAADRSAPHAVHAYETGGGRLRWRAVVEPRIMTAQAPVRAAGLLLGVATGLHRTKRTVFVYALEAATGLQRWWRPVEPDTAAIPKATLTHALNTVFVSLDGRVLYALDATTGAVRWRTRPRLRTGGSSGRAPTGADVPVVAGGAVHLCCADGVLRAFDARRGRQRWAFDTGEGPAATGSLQVGPRPIAEGGLLYVASRGTAASDHRSTVHALNAADGRVRWRRSADGSHGRPVMIMAAGALHVSDGEAVTAHDPLDGAVRRRLDLRALRLAGSTGLLTDGARLHVLASPQVLALSLEK
ncbi:PQQ-binding-like beta-propeller repeat protein [Actinomadura algeriensis]|uniref:Outer membrane protein assembly factor BamB n=1 Tax=Actinomadura algeriensis TaxID=1679523 RepID=A0ABR9JR72_9ACTN|nr:PQQ-binding-like beta-propeller repeat protein [Actinomadura algeriensis]MBE1532878.1 outer membrane protein assembly factor BamB [Actinomadura algeriensis]